MDNRHELILKCRNDVVNGKKITKSMISELFNINTEFSFEFIRCRKLHNKVFSWFRG